MADHAALVRLDVVGPALAAATGDGRWTDVEAELIAGGKSNLTFAVRSPAGELVLRRPPSGDLLPSAHDMGRETRVQRALAATAVPVPSIVLHDEGDLLGVPFYVMTKVPGHVVRDELPAGYADTPEQKRAIADALVDVLVELHAVDPAAVGLAGYGRPDGFLERQLRRWTAQWESTATQPVAAVDALAARLSRRLPASAPRPAIVHGDYRLDNCLLDPHDPARIAAVLDWELSTVGDPLTDVGMLLFYWVEPGEPAPVLTPAVTRAPGFPARSHLAERYAARAGLDLGELVFYEAFAHFKFAAIAQGIAARVAAGAMAGQDFGDLDGEVRRIAEAGLARLEQES
ncbi:phosphotransferase family protein [Blastococcus litoris]|uniref:phosphotransferase family protein n=1 Tax=Blastococcus litoris TaxID=2171622 RepID=UPI000E303CC9|nr:phosphotransferase family protein [Blastococcus litoris]